MKKYHLELRRRSSIGDTMVASIIIPASDNMNALLNGQKAFEDKFKEHGYEVWDCGMFVGCDVMERDILIGNNNDETIDLGLHITKIEE